jgi:tRNA-dihydrouridine synthase
VEVAQAIRLHVREMVAYYGEHAGLSQFRKHLKRYIADVPRAEDYLPQLLTAVSLADFEGELDDLETAVPAGSPIRELSNSVVVIESLGN